MSCVNHGRDAMAFIDDLPLDAVGEIHLASRRAQELMATRSKPHRRDVYSLVALDLSP